MAKYVELFEAKLEPTKKGCYHQKPSPKKPNTPLVQQLTSNHTKDRPITQRLLDYRAFGLSALRDFTISSSAEVSLSINETT